MVLFFNKARGRANFWPTLEVFLTDYPAPLLKELDVATDLYLFQPEARG
jgi:hypothetical protein